MTLDQLRRACPLFVALLLTTACTQRGPEPEIVDGTRYGVTEGPFYGRWWHYLERGLSWADGGFYERAERDLRRCLSMRQSDSRRARTYGMRFVHCFANRELGAVLLEQGRLEEARRHLERSLRQEPSAKAEFLLAQIARREDREAGYRRDALDDAAHRQPSRLVLLDSTRVEGTLRLRGRVASAQAVRLLVAAASGAVQPIELAADGAFAAEVEPAATLLLVDADSDAVLQRVSAASVDSSPALRVDAPSDGSVLAQRELWIRYRASHDQGLHRLELQVDDAEPHVVETEARILAGTLPLTLADGVNRISVRAVAADGEILRDERRVRVQGDDGGASRLRASAVVLPLLHPFDDDWRVNRDDPHVLAALVDDRRFRYVDRRVDPLLERELALVDAGYVDRDTAVRAGKRLQARYVLAGTMRRNPREAECFLRVIQSGSGRVVAVADAYVRLDEDEDEDFAPLYRAIAGRLRQAMPVLSGELRVADGTVRRFHLHQDHRIRGTMRFHLIEDPAHAAPDSGRQIDVALDTRQPPTPGDGVEGIEDWDGVVISE